MNTDPGNRVNQYYLQGVALSLMIVSDGKNLNYY